MSSVINGTCMTLVVILCSTVLFIRMDDSDEAACIYGALIAGAIPALFGLVKGLRVVLGFTRPT